MLDKIITIQISPPLATEENVVLLGESLLKAHSIPANRHITLRLGSAKVPIKIMSVPNFDSMRIHYKLAQQLGLSAGIKARVKYVAHAQLLLLGPLLGVMMNKVKTKSQHAPFGNNTTFCKELTDACQAEGIVVYFFSPDMIRLKSSKLEGWGYHKGWSKGSYPMPSVVYNRLTSRILENKSIVQQFMRSVKKRYRTKIFNEKYLNKTEVFSVLRKQQGLRKYLPESHSLASYSTLHSMCKRYNVVFLKPILGSLGKGIIRISRQADGSLICQHDKQNGAVKQTYRTTEQLYKAIAPKIKARRYQIQQGLQLISNGSQLVDFRALVQKKDQKEWGITSIVARIAGNHQFVSNLARGGRLSPVKEALQKSNLSAVKQVNARLRKAAVDIAKGIDVGIPQHFAELGVDLAVDRRGRVWLLEVNSKPSKNDGTPLNEDKVRPSVRQVAKYVRQLVK